MENKFTGNVNDKRLISYLELLDFEKKYKDLIKIDSYKDKVSNFGIKEYEKLKSYYIKHETFELVKDLKVRFNDFSYSEDNMITVEYESYMKNKNDKHNRNDGIETYSNPIEVSYKDKDITYYFTDISLKNDLKDNTYHYEVSFCKDLGLVNFWEDMTLISSVFRTDSHCKYIGE